MQTIQTVSNLGKVFMLPSGAFALRNNCKYGVWMRGATDGIGGASKLNCVVLAFETLYGFIPKVPNEDRLDELLKQKKLWNKSMTLNDKIIEAFSQCGEFWCYIIFVVTPDNEGVDPEIVPPGMVCSTLVKSTGLYKAGTGFYGNGGYLDRLVLKGSRPQDVITTMALEQTHSAPDGSDVLGVTFDFREPSKDEKPFVKACQEFMVGQDFQVDPDILRSTTQIDYFNEASRREGEKITLLKCFNWVPEIKQLMESQAFTIPETIVIEGNTLALLESEVEESTIPFIDHAFGN